MAQACCPLSPLSPFSANSCQTLTLELRHEKSNYLAAIEPTSSKEQSLFVKELELPRHVKSFES